MSLHAEIHIFFRRQIENEQSIDTGCFRFAMKSLRNRIGKSDSNKCKERSGLSILPEFAERNRERRGRLRPPQRALGGKLIHNSVGQRIGERQSKLNQIRTCVFERTNKINRFLEIRIARANVWNETLALFERSRAKQLSIRFFTRLEVCPGSNVQRQRSTSNAQ